MSRKFVKLWEEKFRIMNTLDTGSVGIPTGSRMIDFALRGVDENTYSLKSFAEKKAVVVVFSCNHCPYVQAYEERMIQIQSDYASKGATLVAINSNDETGYPEDSFPNMVKRANEKAFNFPYLRDESQNIARRYGALCTPHCFAFDSNRILQYKGRIDDNWRNPIEVKTQDLRNALDAILINKSPPVQETRPYGCSIKWKR